MTPSFPSITDEAVGQSTRDGVAKPETAAAQLAHGVLEELFRRREAIGFSLMLLLCLLAAAVGLRVWGVDGTSATALESSGFSVSNTSSDALEQGPSGTWQRWGDLGSQKRSQSPAAAPSGTSTTTFTDTGAASEGPVASPTTTTTQPGSS